MTLESVSSCIIKDNESCTITHVDIKGGSRSGSKSSHVILEDLQCDFIFIYLLVLVLVFRLFFSLSFVLVFVFFRFSFSFR